MNKVAVVAVHGVADQTPASSARSIADLLCADGEHYTEFTEVPLRIPRKPLHAGPKQKDAGLRYMHGQLAGYTSEGAGAVYETVRLEGKRRSDGTGVHVYEVYWADLSRIGEGTYRLFAELYQLLLHLPSLGRNAIENACVANGAREPWIAATWLARRAVQLFTIPIPLLNVVLLSLVLLGLSAEIGPAAAQAAVAAAVPMLALLAGGALLLSRLRVPRPVYYAVPVLIVAAGATAFVLLQGREFLARLVAAEAAVLAVGMCGYLASKYDVMKPGAKWFGLAASAAASMTAIVFLAGHPSTEAGVYRAALNAAEIVVLALQFSWVLFIVFALAAAIVGWFAARWFSENRRLARRAAWTGRFGIFFPAALFATTTLALWMLIAWGVGELMPGKTSYTSRFIDPGLNEPLQEFMLSMLKRQAAGLEFTTGALALFLLAAVWAAGPSVVQEVAPPAKHDSAEQVGQWLSRGILFVAAAGNLLTLSFVAVAAAKFLGHGDDYVIPILSTVAALVGLVLATKNLTKSVRAVVDVLLDVDNYMRQSPGDATPRARIAERFISLLRHLIGSGYERIVIVAHSQGTVISADLLRYLQNVHPEEIPANVEIRLFTMGSPLRQMYAAAFPYLYSWIDDPEGKKKPEAPALIGDDAPPPLLGEQVKGWSNAYRSGDYVGRHLWLDDTYPKLWIRSEEPARDTTGARRQFCIGAGAHTHYWNAHGGDVARHLSELI